MERVLASDKRVGAVRENVQSVADPLSMIIEKHLLLYRFLWSSHRDMQSCYQDGTRHTSQHDNGQVANIKERLQGMIAGNNGLF